MFEHATREDKLAASVLQPSALGRGKYAGSNRGGDNAGSSDDAAASVGQAQAAQGVDPVEPPLVMAGPEGPAEPQPDPEPQAAQGVEPVGPPGPPPDDDSFFQALRICDAGGWRWRAKVSRVVSSIYALN